jgi:hypothetical protein
MASPFGQPEAVNFRYAKVCGGFKLNASAQSLDSLDLTGKSSFQNVVPLLLFVTFHAKNSR